MKYRSIFVLLCVLGLISSLVLAMTNNQESPDEISFYFDKKPFINPNILKDMTTWLSDKGDQVVAIDLHGAQDSNRYSAKIRTGDAEKEPPYVYFKKDDESFGYKLIGKTDSGIYVLETSSGGSGSGKFKELVLIAIEKDKKLSYRREQAVLELGNDRLVIKKLGAISLGDRYNGRLEVKGNYLHIGKDQSGHAGIFKEDSVIRIGTKR